MTLPMKPAKKSRAWIDVPEAAMALGIDAKKINGTDGVTTLWVLRDGSGRLLTSRALPGQEAALFLGKLLKKSTRHDEPHQPEPRG